MSELSREARSLIASARHEEGLTPEEHARYRAQLLQRLGIAAGVAGAASLAPAKAAATADAAATSASAGAAAPALAATAAAPAPAVKAGVSFGLGTLGGKIAIGVTIAAVAVTAHLFTRGSARSDTLGARLSTSAVVSTSAAIVARMKGSLAEAESATHEAPVAPGPAEEREERPAPSPRAAASSRSASPSAGALDNGFQEDAKLLRDVRAALGAGKDDEALEMLEARRANPTEGILGQERAAAHILTLCRLGRTAEARAASERFLRQHPRSPLGERIRRACAGDAPPPPAHAKGRRE
ncbi:hypothetical protein WME89_04225 [Sorangium sp. So ce321]|uniref:hypothetical protein n=1 Tax=Sorangium sp. So ce321 TaxID=3133300 RepID=UPI003F60BCA1